MLLQLIQTPLAALARGLLLTHLEGALRSVAWRSENGLPPPARVVIADDRTSKGMAFSKTQTNMVCPWHGYEFDIRTGRHAGNSNVGLRSMKVRVTGGDVILTVPDARDRPTAAMEAGAPA